MKSLQDRYTRSAREMSCPAYAVISPHNRAMRCGTHLGTVVLLAALFAGTDVAAQAQNAGRPKESPTMQQLHQAPSLADHGDPQGAMRATLRMLQQNPKFVPALKLKGSVLAESGPAAGAAAAYA